MAYRHPILLHQLFLPVYYSGLKNKKPSIASILLTKRRRSDRTDEPVETTTVSGEEVAKREVIMPN